MSRAYEYRHRVGFEETNVVGNVYYANHVRWQGRCRELFLCDHVPEILKELEQGLVLVTTRVSCEYFNELYAFDEVSVRMRAGAVTQSRVTMLFEYYEPQANWGIVFPGWGAFASQEAIPGSGSGCYRSSAVRQNHSGAGRLCRQALCLTGKSG